MFGAEQFSTLRANAAACPFFIVPVIKEDGAFFNLLSQWQDTVFLLTFLDDYQADPASAQPYLTISTYGELLDSKQTGLLRGDVGAALKYGAWVATPAAATTCT